MRKILYILILAFLFLECKKNEPEPVLSDFTFVEGLNGEFSFTNKSTGAVTYEWDFGGGKISTDKDSKFTFDDNKDYSVSLTAKGDGGQNQKIKSLKVTTKPDYSTPFLTSFGGKLWSMNGKDSPINFTQGTNDINFSISKLDRTTIQISKMYEYYQFKKVILDAANSFIINETVEGYLSTPYKCLGTGKLNGKTLTIDFTVEQGSSASVHYYAICTSK